MNRSSRPWLNSLTHDATSRARSVAQGVQKRSRHLSHFTRYRRGSSIDCITQPLQPHERNRARRSLPSLNPSSAASTHCRFPDQPECRKLTPASLGGSSMPTGQVVSTYCAFVSRASSEQERGEGAIRRVEASFTVGRRSVELVESRSSEKDKKEPYTRALARGLGPCVRRRSVLTAIRLHNR